MHSNWCSAFFGLRVAPQAADSQPWRCIPSLAELLSKWLVGPSPEFNTVSAVVHHFAKCKVNDARMCAKEILAQEPSHRITIFCVVAHVQGVLKHDAILPRGFQHVLKMREQVRKPKKKQQCHAQDICKVLVAIYLLKKMRPDQDFSVLLNLLAQAGAPGMQDAYGTSPHTGLRLMQFLVRRKVTTTAIGLVRSPMLALIIDGAHKKAMRGAPDIIQGRYSDMYTGALHTRHLGLIVPQTADFLHTESRSPPASRLKETTQGPERLYDRLIEQLHWLLQHTADPPFVPELLTKLGVVASDGASTMAGVRKAFGAVLRKQGAGGGALLQFVDVGHGCESGAKAASKHVRVHQRFMHSLQDLCRVMRKSNVLAAQVEVLMQHEGQEAASCGRNVVQRWVEQTIRLIEAVLHNVPQTVAMFKQKIKELKQAIWKSSNRNEAGDSENQKKRKEQLRRFEVLKGEMCSLSFHLYTARLQDVLGVVKCFSLEGQQKLACASRIAHTLAEMKSELRKLRDKQHGPYERFLRNALQIRDRVLFLQDLKMTKEGYKHAIAAKVSFVDSLLTQFDVRVQNPPYAHLRVADYRLWKCAESLPQEMDQVVAT